MSGPDQSLLQLAQWIDPERARFAWRTCERMPQPGACTLLATAYPAYAHWLDVDPDLLRECTEERLAVERDFRAYGAQLRAEVESHDAVHVSSVLRRFTRRHKVRIALRELLPLDLGGADVLSTARELSALASAVLDAGLDAAVHVASQRHGPPMRSDHIPSTLCVLGMGKLGGHELNAGSDVDLMFLYDTDDGQTAGAAPLQEFWTRAARVLVGLLQDSTADGVVWRVDLRLRPEGTQGPVVHSMAAMLRYYETWGRLWERAALVRARPVAGNLTLGDELLRELSSFIYRRRVDPEIADRLMQLVERMRAECSTDLKRDLKLGPGGIRDVETFVQSLQLIWGGVEPSIRTRSTLDAVQRLRARGLVLDREAEDLDEAYTLLRRAEHMVQNATGLQTHVLPSERADLIRLARAMGFATADALVAQLASLRVRVQQCVSTLSSQAHRPSRWGSVIAALEQGDVAMLEQRLAPEFGSLGTHELARHLLALAARPDGLLGSMTRQQHLAHADQILEALAQSADPEQAARCLHTFFSRHAASSSAYVSLFAEHIQAARRFIHAMGASAFVGDLVSQRPELGDHVLFSSGIPSVEAVHERIERELSKPEGQGASDIAGALRRTKLRVTLEVALADLAGDVPLSDVTHVLSALADASIERALRSATQQTDGVVGLCVIAVGKLGARELGYGSDLDVLFIFDPKDAADEDVAPVQAARVAQRTIRILSAPHEEGRGYELDTRLRPSGSQGVLVTSLSAFARYHGCVVDGMSAAADGPSAASWERQTLLRARPCAGDANLAVRVMQVAHAVAYEMGAPDANELWRLRTRLEQEHGRERSGRFDLKLGHGGLLDIEFAVQWLQMLHGRDLRVRTASTLDAIDRLGACGYLAARDADVLRGGYDFLRRLEQRLHVVHATSIHLIESDAPGLLPLARRMGLHASARHCVSEELMAQYRARTAAVRQTCLRLLGL